MKIVERVRIGAGPARVWEVLADVERWPRWTPTVTSVESLNGSGLRVGARYRVRQPKLRPAVYEVAACEPLREFTWATKLPGVRMTAVHRLAGAGDGTGVELSFETAGLLGALVGRMYGKLIAEYVATEARSLKAACER
ncbi:MAG TPA: SRPBCC family protein [Acidobacteriaceae bacterium]|nr:SRPBCC family protein [Acidobacteriaceae bacterium]